MHVATCNPASSLPLLGAFIPKRSSILIVFYYPPVAPTVTFSVTLHSEFVVALGDKRGRWRLREEGRVKSTGQVNRKWIS